MPIKHAHPKMNQDIGFGRPIWYATLIIWTVLFSIAGVLQVYQASRYDYQSTIWGFNHINPDCSGEADARYTKVVAEVCYMYQPGKYWKLRRSFEGQGAYTYTLGLYGSNSTCTGNYLEAFIGDTGACSTPRTYEGSEVARSYQFYVDPTLSVRQRDKIDGDDTNTFECKRHSRSSSFGICPLDNDD